MNAKKLLPIALLLSTTCLSADAAGNKKYKSAELTKEQQSFVNKANGFARDGKADKALAEYQKALATANDSTQCIAIVDGSGKYGHVLADARRAGLNRALAVAKNESDLFAIALEARKSELFEITKSAIDALISQAPTKEDLYELARKAQQNALDDVAHMALQRAYSLTKTVPEALAFAKQAKLLGVEDVSRNAVKDVIDDSNDTHEICSLIPEFEPMGYSDLVRRALRKALDFCKSVDDCKEIFDTSRHYGQQDITNLAAYRGKQMLLMKQVDADKAAYQQKLEEWRAGKMASQEQQAADDLARQQKGGAKPNGPGF